MVNSLVLRMIVRSALISIVVYISVAAIGMVVLGGLASRALHVGPQALTLLYTATSLLARLAAMFTGGFMVGIHPAGGRISSMLLVGVVTAVFLFLCDMVWLAPIGISITMLRAVAASPLMNVAFGLVVLGLHVGIAVLGGVIGRHTCHMTTEQIS